MAGDIGVELDSSIDLAEYNNYMLSFLGYYDDYEAKIKAIVDAVKGTVMVKDKWTTDAAANFALWYCDQKGRTDGCDLLSAVVRSIRSLIKTTCCQPILEVDKISGAGAVSAYPYLKKALASPGDAGVFIQNARKSGNKIMTKDNGSFGEKEIRLKRDSGEKVVVKALEVNGMLKTIETNVKAMLALNKEVKKLVTSKILNTGTQVIMITGFEGENLKKTLAGIESNLNTFEKQTQKATQEAVTIINETTKNLRKHMETSSEEK